MRRTLRTALAATGVIAGLSLAAPAFGDDGGRPLQTALTGAAECNAVGVCNLGDPDGSGTASLRLNPGQEEICYELTVSNIAPATAAHIHIGGPAVAGPVVVGLMPPTSGSSSACASVPRDLVLNILKNPAGFYVNVHNMPYPAGAVRGQLSRP